MKLRNQKYIRRKKAIKDMIRFKDLQSFLKAGMELTRNAIVRKDIMNTLFSLDLSLN